MRFSKKALLELRSMKAQIDRMLSLYGSPVPSAGDATSHYIVEAPDDGIAAATDGVPSKTSCKIARRWGEDPKQIETTERKVDVFNRGDAIEPGTLVTVHRDAWSDYWVETPQGGLLVFQAPEDGIPARAGAVLGTATVDVMVLNEDDELVYAGTTAEVYNYITQTVCDSGDRLGQAANRSGKWWVISDDCNDTSATTFEDFDP